MKNKKLIIFITIVSLIATTVFVLPIMSYGVSKYHNYSPDKKGKTNTSAVMRSGSSTSKKKICTVPKGKSLTIYGYDEVPGYNWYKVKYGSKTGYIRRDLIKVTNTSTNTVSASKSKYHNYNPDKKGKTTISVNMRKGSSTSYGKVCTVPKGKSLIIYGYDEVPGYNWYKVKYGSKTGYIRRDYVNVTGSYEKASSITGSNITYPTTLKQGNGFVVKGTLKSTYNISEVKAGIMKKSTNKFYSNYTAIAKPNATSYDISKLNSKVPFSKAKPGTYYYTVWAKDIKGKEFTVLKKSFTVKKSTTVLSTLNIKNASKPVNLEIGQGFVVKGIVSSNYNLDNVTVKVKDSDGSIMKGCNESVNPTGKSYDINNLNKNVRISTLDAGDYCYEVVGKDESGTIKTLVDQDFIIDGAQTSSQGKTLIYNVSKFKKIGKQPYSGPCGLYAMAYGRLVIDGDFKISSRYNSVCDQLRAEYGMGSNVAHWDQADAHSVWTTSAKVAYQNVLKEINQGRPCIIPITTTRGTNHFVTVIGYKKGTTASNVDLSKLVILDPGYGVQCYGNTYGYKDKTSDNARYIRFR